MPGIRSSTELPDELLAPMQAIKAAAREHGLDFFETIFEVVDFGTMNQIAAFGGFPVRYPHWRWGMEYEKLSKRDAYGLGRIYELVINNDPCYAYLQESNSTLDQKLVMAHVYAHADFFKNNAWFAQTNRKMMDEMANHATRVRRHIEREGRERVEKFLDLCHMVDGLIDPHSALIRRESGGEEGGEERAEAQRFDASPHMDPFINPREKLAEEERRIEEEASERKGRVPESPTRDVLLFLLRHAPLDAWQRDILSIIRDEAYYFAPQGMTKVMNEGWATYWHSKLMTERFLEPKEVIDYADQHSGVVHMPPGGFNPYKLGVELFKDIEARWDKGRHGPEWERLERIGEKERFDDRSMAGREKIFQVRSAYNDVTFLDEFLTEAFIDERKMFKYKRDPRTGELVVVTRDFELIKQSLLTQLANSGQPYLYVVDANYMNRGELYLAQKHIGADLEVSPAIEALKALRAMWGRPVRLHARVDDDRWLFTCEEEDGEVTREKVSEETPEPAHTLS